MEKLKKIIDTIEAFAPMSLKEEYDTPGLHVGSYKDSIKRVLVSLNITKDVINEAIDKNCQLIISHHPAIFGEEIVDVYTQDIIDIAKKEHIALYSAHTNLDSAKGGINDKLCDILNISCESNDLKPYRVGNLQEDMTLKELIKIVSKSLKDNKIRSVGDLDKKVKKVIVSSGAGARDDDLLEYAKDIKADVIIGGESKISIALKMKEYGVNLIEVGHYESEIICMDILKNVLEDGLKIKVFKSKKDVSPYNK